MKIDDSVRNYYVHRLIWMMHRGEWPSMDIDHINGIPNDNRIENLREATSRQNKWNTSITKNNGLCKGVYKSGKKFRARVWLNKTDKNLGTFFTYGEAMDAVLNEYLRVCGEFARKEIQTMNRFSDANF